MSHTAPQSTSSIHHPGARPAPSATGSAPSSWPPEVDLPSLREIRVTVPAAAPLTEQELVGRLLELARERAARRELARGEPVGMHDEVQVDLLCYVSGELVPGTARSGQILRMEPGEGVPGLVERLVGMPVGGRRDVPVVLPRGFEVPGLRGHPAVFRVEVKAAWEVQVPDPESPAFLKALGRGRNLEETLASIAREMKAELDQRVREDARQRVLDALAARVEVEVPEEILVWKLNDAWQATEGAALDRQRVPEEQRERARAAWMSDPAHRAAAGRELRILLALDAIARRDGLVVTEALRRATVEAVARDLGMTPRQLAEELARDPRAAEQIDLATFYNLVVDHLMQQAQVRHERAE